VTPRLGDALRRIATAASSYGPVAWQRVPTARLIVSLGRNGFLWSVTVGPEEELDEEVPAEGLTPRDALLERDYGIGFGSERRTSITPPWCGSPDDQNGSP
jgi:hypothetical protein